MDARQHEYDTNRAVLMAAAQGVLRMIQDEHHKAVVSDYWARLKDGKIVDPGDMWAEALRIGAFLLPSALANVPKASTD